MIDVSYSYIRFLISPIFDKLCQTQWMADLGKNGINEIKGFSNPVPELDSCTLIWKDAHHVCKFDDVWRNVVVYSTYEGGCWD